MQFVNDDMDELFRQAAKDYSLNTDGGDWNAVLNKMQDGDNTKREKGNKRKYLFLLLLLPLLIICTTYIKNDSTHGINGPRKTDVNVTVNTDNEKGTNTANKTNSLTVISDDKVVSSSTNSSESFNHSANKEINDLLANNKVPTSFNKNEPGNRVASKNFKLTKPGKEVTGQGFASDNVFNSGIDNSNSGLKEKTNALDNTKQPDVSELITQKSSEKTPEKINEQPPVAVTNESEKKERQPKIRGSKFFYGFQLGPDFSMVKSLKIDGTGYSAGLLLGYNINKKFAIETGLLWDHKRYESEGRYFSTEKLDWPHVNILDLSGFCNMYEIPVNLRYNFSRNSKRTVYATAGVSSYLMKKENYDYSYIRYGAYGYGNREYKNTTNNWLSIAHLSVGIQKRIGAIGDLRVEPYIKLPLHGVGIGSMPLRSTGIYLGITRPIR